MCLKMVYEQCLETEDILRKRTRGLVSELGIVAAFEEGLTGRLTSP